MKTFALVSFAALAFSAAAATVKINSFYFLGNGDSRVAELCGTVSDATTSPSYVQITVDPNTGRQGHYNTLAGKDGKFCALVLTYRGTANVSILDSEVAVNAEARR